MEKYDAAVIGAGSGGLSVAFSAAAAGLKTALIEKGNPGGTCVNAGCVPSKSLLVAASRISMIRDSGKLGIKAEGITADFQFIMGRMRGAINKARQNIENFITSEKNIRLYQGEAHFSGPCQLEVSGRRITGEKIFIASGTRPMLPPIKGLADSGYLTNESVLNLNTLPKNIIMIGGGYISMEYAHFFSAMGADVTIIEAGPRLLANEDKDISAAIEAAFKKRMQIYTGAKVTEVAVENGMKTVQVEGPGGQIKLKAEEIMLAVGRVSNADLLKPELAGIETDKRGYIKTDDYLRTSAERVWALGDAAGRQMFTHAADKGAEVAWHNASNPQDQKKMDWGAVPHAVFTEPEIAGVGLTGEQVRSQADVLVGRAEYQDVTMGQLSRAEGFAKAIVEKGSGKILGFHIIGPEASVLIQEAANALAEGRGAAGITEKMHIFPSLSELIPEAIARAK